jgi:hypothetical protein
MVKAVAAPAVLIKLLRSTFDLELLVAFMGSVVFLFGSRGIQFCESLLKEQIDWQKLKIYPYV